MKRIEIPVEEYDHLMKLIHTFDDCGFEFIIQHHHSHDFEVGVSVVEGNDEVYYFLTVGAIEDELFLRFENDRDRGYQEQLWRE